MRKYLLIGLGGVLGALSRSVIKGIDIRDYHGNIPLNTLIVNITGSFILALVLTVAFEIWNFDEDIRLGIATGFLGAYTTFSTLCKEIVGLLNQGSYLSAVSYVTASIVLGLTAAYMGVIIAREAAVKWVKKRPGDMKDEVVIDYDGEVD